MNNNCIELAKQSENGDKLSQIKLFFKLYYDYDDVYQAAYICDKLRKDNLFLEAVWHFYGFNKHYCGVYWQSNGDTYRSQTIFEDICDKTDVDEIKYYAYTMRALCLISTNPLHNEYLTIAAEHGNEYAHVILASKGTMEDKIYHYERAAAVYNKVALLQLAKIYLYNDTYNNPQLAIKYYQNALDYGYTIHFSRIVNLNNYDINATIYFLEYVTTSHSYDAILVLANIYATNNTVLNQKLAMDLYKQVPMIDPRGFTNIHNIVKTGNFDWSPKYHSIWPKISVQIRQKYNIDHKCNKSTLLETSFESQVIILLYITKYRNLSSINFTKLLYKNIILAIITQLSKIWITEAFID